MRSTILDTQLLVLLTVGATSKNMIAKHKNLTAYTVDDFDLLQLLLGSEPRVLLLPNVLSEAANLLRQHREPERSALMDTFARFILHWPERYVESADAVARTEYRRLGLTDSAILACSVDESEILTADAGLHIAASKLGLATTNFNHKREEFGLV